MVFAILSVLIAGIVEIYRKKHISIQQQLALKTFNASSISVFAQVPQFTLIGASEVFTSIAGRFLHTNGIVSCDKQVFTPLFQKKKSCFM